jgi:hypothetical protein
MEHASECDCCGELKYGCRDVTWRGLDTHACPKCLNDEDEDEAADRGDWEFHRDYDD